MLNSRQQVLLRLWLTDKSMDVFSFPFQRATSGCGQLLQTDPWAVTD